MDPGVPEARPPALVPAEAWLPLLWAGGGGAHVSWEMILGGQALPVGGREEAHPGPAGLGWGMADSDDCGSHSWRERSQAEDPSTENGGPRSMSRKVIAAPETVSAPGACWKCPEGWEWGRVDWQVLFPTSPQPLHLLSDGKESACNAGDPGWIPGS